ncbi:MAG: FimB/Mfa2 family fimbrial subunit [Parabacteroides sp.]|nr:FimB/Mfa2 family fimbrial subunit [Parabacteroides sp.]
MKKWIFLLFILAVCNSCSDDDSHVEVNQSPPEVPEAQLVSPQLYARLVSRTPLNGLLEVYPCQPNTSVYYGNYYKGVLTAINPYYRVSDGSALKSANPVYLPVGRYNMIYWERPIPDTTVYAERVVTDPQIVLGRNLAQQYYKLKEYPHISDTTCYPVYDLVHAVNSVEIGSEELNADLQRVVAALIVTLRNKDNQKFNPVIYSTEILIGGVAEKINFYTAEPENQTKTVRFELQMSADSLRMSNAPVMVFPTAPNPLLQIVVTLKNGSVKTYQQRLQETLDANTRLRLDLTLNEIFEEGTSSGGFTINQWQEKKETIDLPALP